MYIFMYTIKSCEDEYFPYVYGAYIVNTWLVLFTVEMSYIQLF